MTLNWSRYDQWSIAGRRCGKREEMRQRMAALEGLPTFAVERKCDWKGPDIMTDPKENLDKFDPSEWETPERTTLANAILHMLDGGVAFQAGVGRFYRRIGCEFLIYVYPEKRWDIVSLKGAHDGNWRIAVRKPKSEPVKPAEPTADDILNALKCGKRVVDADGEHVALCYRNINIETGEPNCAVTRVHFPLTIKPEPKSRRRVTREEAIIAMVKDPRQRAWDKDGHEHRWYPAFHAIRIRSQARPEDWIETCWVDEYLYLDPPEGEG